MVLLFLAFLKLLVTVLLIVLVGFIQKQSMPTYARNFLLLVLVNSCNLVSGWGSQISDLCLCISILIASFTMTIFCQCSAPVTDMLTPGQSQLNST